jgi:hypothetical protein
VCRCRRLARSAARSAEWGSVKGRFVYNGDVRVEPISVTKDQEFCGKHDLVDEEIVVGEDNGLQNVFVYLYLRTRDKVEVHPDYESGEIKPAILDNNGCRFVPHAMTLWTKQPLEVKNSDPGIGHNTNVTLVVNSGSRFNQIVPNDAPIVKQFERSEPFPMPVACNIHPWMKAYVLIRDNPYMVVSGKDGSFEIKNLPAGEHTFVLWHEAPGTLQGLEAGGDKANRTGRVEWTIPAGETLDLGDIVVTPAILKK